LQAALVHTRTKIRDHSAVSKPIQDVGFFESDPENGRNAMSAISSVGSSTAALSQLIQASANKQPVKAATPVARPATQSAGNDGDHDGDSDGGGIDVTA
jgi:hypothetical protein